MLLLISLDFKKKNGGVVSFFGGVRWRCLKLLVRSFGTHRKTSRYLYIRISIILTIEMKDDARIEQETC